MDKPAKIQKQQPAANDPRPQWMRDFHNETKGGGDRFRKFAGDNLHIDIDAQLEYDLEHGRGDKAPKVLQSLASNTTLMFYQDAKRFCIIIPKLKAIVTLFPGSQHTVELLGAAGFQNRVKMLYVFYPRFEYPSIKLVQSALTLIVNGCKLSPSYSTKHLTHAHE